MEIRRDKFLKSAIAHIAEVWVKRKNPMFPKETAKYPARITNFVNVRIDGKRRLFRIIIQENL